MGWSFSGTVTGGGSSLNGKPIAPSRVRSAGRRAAGDRLSLRAQPGADQPARVGGAHRRGAGDAAAGLGGAGPLLRRVRLAGRLLGARAASVGSGRRARRSCRARAGRRPTSTAAPSTARPGASWPATGRIHDQMMRILQGVARGVERALAVSHRRASRPRSSPAGRRRGWAAWRSRSSSVGGRHRRPPARGAARRVRAVLVVANDPAPWAALGVEVVPDRVAGGRAAGRAPRRRSTAADDATRVVCVAGDMPFLAPALLALAARPGARRRRGGAARRRRAPSRCSRATRAALLPVVEARAARGRSCAVHELLSGLRRRLARRARAARAGSGRRSLLQRQHARGSAPRRSAGAPRSCRSAP